MSADTLALLIAKGVVGDDLVDIVRAIDADTACAAPVQVDQAAERRREWDRNRKASLPRNWPELRDAVFERDDYHCSYCGERFAKAHLHCDHVVPLSNGGSSTMDNLATACGPCNISKGALDLAIWSGRS